MSRIRRRRLSWTPPQATDVQGYNVYADDSDTPTFLAQVDAGEWPVLATVTEAELVITEDLLPEGDYDFAVVAFDDAGGFSDPLSPEVWQDVPLDVTPPDPPTGGAIDFVD